MEKQHIFVLLVVLLVASTLALPKTILKSKLSKRMDRSGFPEGIYLTFNAFFIASAISVLNHERREWVRTKRAPNDEPHINNVHITARCLYQREI
jgi:hypothetical protein